MIRPFLFLAGEYAATMPLVFSRDPWQHTMTTQALVANGDGTFRRANLPEEQLRGVIWFASVDSDQVRRSNLRLLIEGRFPCWPSPEKMLAIDNRHVVMRACINAGLVDHEVHIVKQGEPIPLPFPFVLKTGNLHRGEGKHLIDVEDALPAWEGEATAEPFFIGTSARVLVIEDRWFGIRFDNPTTWIRNAAGADLQLWPDIPKAAVEHAHRVHEHFGLEISGVDYVIGADGAPHFLEYNQFPGVGASDEIQEVARALFARKMTDVERMAGFTDA